MSSWHYVVLDVIMPTDIKELKKMRNDIDIDILERIIDMYNIKNMVKSRYSIEYINEEIEKFEKTYNVSFVNDVMFINGRDNE